MGFVGYQVSEESVRSRMMLAVLGTDVVNGGMGSAFF